MSTMVDRTSLEELLGRFVTDLGATIPAGNVVIGDRLGLYRALANSGPATSTRPADRAGAGERYVREWLPGQAASYTPDEDSYWLSEARAAAFADPDGLALPGAFRLALACLGASTRILAASYPASTVDGFYYHADSIELPRRATAEAGLADRVRCTIGSAQEFPGSDYDLIATFDCLHDMGDPIGAARHIRGALAEDGVWLLVEPFAGDRLSDNLTPVGRVYYNFSAFLCVPHAGAETPFNLVYEVRP